MKLERAAPGLFAPFWCREGPSMEHFLGVWFEFLFNYWQEASPAHYAVLVGTIVIVGWLISRFTST